MIPDGIPSEIRSYVNKRSKEEIISELRDEMVWMTPEARQRGQEYLETNKDNVEGLRQGLAEQLTARGQDGGGSRKIRKSKRSKKKSKKKKSKKKKYKRRKSKRRR